VKDSEPTNKPRWIFGPCYDLPPEMQVQGTCPALDTVNRTEQLSH